MTTIAADLLPTKTISITEPTPEEVSLAHDALPGILDRYGGEAGRVPRPDFMDASGVLLRAHAHATLPVNAARWASLPASELDPGLLPILRTLGRAPDLQVFDAHGLRAAIERHGLVVEAVERHGSTRRDFRVFIVARRPA